MHCSPSAVGGVASEGAGSISTQLGSSSSAYWASALPLLGAPAELEVGIAASLSQADGDASVVNSQISKAILSSRSIPRKVCLMEFKRDPESFHHTLLNCPELKSCRDALAAWGFNPELPSQAKAFVRPDLFEATLEAVSLQGFALKGRHVLVEPDLEEVVQRVLKVSADTSLGCKGSEGVTVKRQLLVPIAFAQEVVQSELPVLVKRTFIEVSKCSSLRSVPTSGIVTVSTSDAHCISNPRAA